MPKDYKPPHDANDVFTRYKELYEGERELKPTMREMAERELKAGATIGQLARLTGLTPEVFRRMARDLGVERKREPTVGKLTPAPTAAAPRRQAASPVPADAAPTEHPGVSPEVAALSYEEARDLFKDAEVRHVQWAFKMRRTLSTLPPGRRFHAGVQAGVDEGLIELPGADPASSEETSG